MMVRVAVRPCLFSGGAIMHVCVRTMLVATGLWVCVAPHVPAQEPVTITGKVTSDAGQPLGQVEVAIPSMGLGGLSRDDGSFTVVVPGARVTGAGTSAAANALGSVRNNVAADQIEKASETNMVEALAAKAPNVTVVQQSGDPGASSFINIRGISTILGSNQPLFVVDGVPVDNSTFSTSNFNAPDDGGGTITPGGQTEGTVQTNRASDINPNDIESVEILKGPAASAIYGARAAAGVILITTKSGRSGPTHFSFRSSTSFDDINHTYPLQTKYGQGTQGTHANTAPGGQCDTPGAGICGRSWGPLIPDTVPVYDHAAD